MMAPFNESGSFAETAGKILMDLKEMLSLDVQVIARVWGGSSPPAG
jgi:hypothetical protein